MTATLTTLVSFSGINGEVPKGDLIADSAGDLFGTTSDGGANEAGGINGNGTVFEIAKTAGGYASAPTTLVNFNYEDGTSPVAGLLADASGNLFGTTESGGASDPLIVGTVFEIAKTAGGYASTPTTLVRFGGPFNGVVGSMPEGSLIADSAATCSAPLPRAARTKPTARRSRLPRLPEATPALRPRWSVSTWSTARFHWGASLPIPTATCLAQPWAAAPNHVRHGVRNRQDSDRLRQYAHHACQLQRRRRLDSSGGPDRRRQRRPVWHNCRTAAPVLTARCLKSRRLPRDTPAHP